MNPIFIVAGEDFDSDDDEADNISTIISPPIPSNLPIRVFEAEQINLEAEDYTQISDWQNYHSEPPLTLNKELQNFVCSKFLCHNQNVERHIRIVSRESRRTCSEAALNGNLYICKEVAKVNEFLEAERQRLSTANFSHWSSRSQTKS